MKIFKKIWLTITLGLAASFFGFFLSGQVLAAVPPTQTGSTYPIETYYSACVDKVLVNGGGTLCKFFNSSVPDTTMLYGTCNAYSVNTISSQVNYQASYDTTTVGPAKIPNRVNLLNASYNDFSTLNDSVFSFFGQGNQAPNSKVNYAEYITAAPDVKNPCNGGDLRYVLLGAPAKDGTLKIVALVNKTIYKSSDSSFGTIYAYKINKTALASNPDGSPVTPTPPTTPVGGGSGVDCSSQSAGLAGAAEAYIMCPLIDAAQSASEALTNLIQTQLSFTVQKNIDSNNQGTGVKNAWGEIRDLASIILVIIMLVMVISQAVSWGPFDAYTVRKILPKLVVAVIAMQVSWSLLSYVVQVFDDLGHGVADLLYGPFGGSSAVTLQSILTKAGINAFEAGTVAWAGLFTIGAIAVLSLPTLALMAWGIVMAIAVVFVTLAVRQVLIIACLIFAPLAILCWILPGTQRYWKLWYDNFTKLLIMFPMIIGMIAAGQIFALITSSSSNDTLIKFLLIIIGFYGPFFFVPKTFKWGGAALSAAGGAISNVAPKLGGPVTNYLKGTQERSRWHLAREARKAELGRVSRERYAAGLTGEGRFGAIRQAVSRTRLLGATQNPRVIRQQTRAAENEREKILKEQSQETLTHFMAQPAFRSGDMREIIDRMMLNGSEHEAEAAIAKLISTRNGAALDTYFLARGTTFRTDPAYIRTITKDDSGNLARTAGDIGRAPF